MMVSSSKSSYSGIFEDKEMERRIQNVVSWRERSIEDTSFEGNEGEKGTIDSRHKGYKICFVDSSSNLICDGNSIGTRKSWSRFRYSPQLSLIGSETGGKPRKICPVLRLGPHFVLLTSENAFTSISKVIIDWELQVKFGSVQFYDGSSKLIYKFGDKRERSKRPKHVIDSIPIDFTTPITNPIEQIRIDIDSPGFMGCPHGMSTFGAIENTLYITIIIKFIILSKTSITVYIVLYTGGGKATIFSLNVPVRH